MRKDEIGRRIGRSLGSGLLVLLLGASLSTPAAGAVYYVGNFAGSTPQDDVNCGTGKGTAPNPHPCATLAYWTANRRVVLASGDTVRLTGTLSSCGSVGCDNLCILPQRAVTYEGRTATDGVSDSYDDAVVDGTLLPGSGGTCRGRLVWAAGTDFTDFVLRDMTIQNAPLVGGYAGSLFQGANCTGTNGTCSGLVIDRVRFTGNAGTGGLQVGKCVSTSGDPCNGNYEVTNLTVRDSQMDDVAFKGIMLCCVDGFLLERNKIFNILGPGCDPQSPDCSIDGPCDDRVGIHVGSKNGIIRQSEVYNSGQSNIDTGSVATDSCDPAANTNVYEQNSVHDALCGSNFGFGHCVFDITVRNNFIYGRGTGVNQKACANHLKIYNNTFWAAAGTRPIQLWENCRGCDFRNNIIRCDMDGECVHVDVASTSAETTWQNNVVVNLNTSGGALAIAERPGGCSSWTDPQCNSNLCHFAASPYNPGLPPDFLNKAADTTLTDGQLASFAAEGDLGRWFGPESGDTDKWGQVPNVASTTVLNPTGLSLDTTDTTAKDNGQTIGSFAMDYWGRSRPQGSAWDMGAAEATSAGAPQAPSLISVVPLP